MAHQLNIYQHEKLIVVVFEGDISIEELKSARLEMINHPDYHESFNGVYDFRKAVKKYRQESLFSFSDTIVKEDKTKGKWCSLNKTPVETGLSELLKNKVKARHPFESFSTVLAASEFLQIRLQKYLKEG